MGGCTALAALRWGQVHTESGQARGRPLTLYEMNGVYERLYRELLTPGEPAPTPDTVADTDARIVA